MAQAAARSPEIGSRDSTPGFSYYRDRPSILPGRSRVCFAEAIAGLFCRGDRRSTVLISMTSALAFFRFNNLTLICPSHAPILSEDNYGVGISPITRYAQINSQLV
jgi:hypothetical protein